MESPSMTKEQFLLIATEVYDRCRYLTDAAKAAGVTRIEADDCHPSPHTEPRVVSGLQTDHDKRVTIKLWVRIDSLQSGDPVLRLT